MYAHVVLNCPQCLSQLSVAPTMEGKIAQCRACEHRFLIKRALPQRTPQEKIASELVKSLAGLIKQADERRAFERMFRFVNLLLCGYAGDYKRHLIFLPPSEN